MLAVRLYLRKIYNILYLFLNLTLKIRKKTKKKIFFRKSKK